MKIFETKDSGERRSFETGAVRDKGSGKGRFDLIPAYCLRRLAELYERGAVKYEARNWQKGMPLSQFIDSAQRHLNSHMEGDDSEDHLTAVVFNIFGYIWTEEQVSRGNLPNTLDDLSEYLKSQKQIWTDVKGGTV